MTYTLRLKCYKCDAMMRAVDRQAGKRTRCAACNAPIRVPPKSIFQQYDGQKVQAPKEPEWDFAHVAEKAKRKNPARSDFIGEVSAAGDDEDMILGRPGQVGGDTDPGGGLPSDIDSMESMGDEIADSFAAAAAGAGAGSDDDDYGDFDQTLSDNASPIARSGAGFTDEAAKPIDDSVVWNDDDEQADLRNMAKSAVADDSEPIEFTDADDDDDDDLIGESEPAGGDSMLGDDSLLADGTAAFDDDYSATLDDSSAGAVARSRPDFSDPGDHEDDFDSLVDADVDGDAKAMLAAAAGGLESGESEPEITDADDDDDVVEFDDSDMDFDVPGGQAAPGAEDDLKALLDDFDDDID